MSNSNVLSWNNSGTTTTLNIPQVNDTLVARATTDTLTNKTLTSPIISTISNTGTLTLSTTTGVIPSGPNSTTSGDILTYNSTNGQIVQDSGIASSAVATLTGTQILTNKSFDAASDKFVDHTDNTKVLNFTLSGMTTAKTLTLTSTQSTTQSIAIPNATLSGTSIVLSEGTLNNLNIPNFISSGGTIYIQDSGFSINNLNQNVSTTASPTFAGLSVTNINVSSTTALLASNTGAFIQIISSAGGAFNITLPTVAQNLSFTVIVTAALGNAVTITASSAIIFGSVVSSDGTAVTGGAITSAKTNIILGTTAGKGDRYEFYSSSGNWFVNGVTSVHGSVTFS